jgi:hypothetical protein
VTLPEAIPIRFTEEEAGYLSVRPVRRQTFRLHELVDMVLRVTGRDAERIRQVLRSGTVVYHDYRYWWEGFEVGAAELAAVLERFPRPEPGRQFDAAACTGVVFESGGPRGAGGAELGRVDATRRRLLRRRSFWDVLMELAAAAPPAYLDFSYERRADLYAVELDAERRARLVEQALKLAPRRVRGMLYGLPGAARAVLVCPRR